MLSVIRMIFPLAVAGGALLPVRMIAAEEQRNPLRLPDGQPLTCIYFFPHWWEPWKSDDEAIRADLKRLRGMGYNTLLLDHEWSQAIDGDWKWLDRSHRLAKEAGLAIVPWLSPKTWSDVLPGRRHELAKQWFGVDFPFGRQQDGSPAAPIIWDRAVHVAGVRYARMYLDRYADQALLRVRWGGKDRPVVSLSVESAWDGGFDDGSIERFRAWCRRKYGSIKALNERWGTAIADWSAIQPRDRAMFDYAGHAEGKAARPQPVEDHVLFRSETIRDVLAGIGREVRRTHPDVLLMAEYPYQYDAEHPHARAYRVQYGADPISCDWADIVLIRATGPLSASELAALERHRRRTGQRFILTYRTYSDWDVFPASDAFSRSVETYAGQAARYGDGFGFYSWNEMVDTHVAFSPTMPASEQHGWTAERAERAIRLVGAMATRYRSLVP
ncbi:MAG: hypothetical protein GX446_03440 [Chthonomonadales bacterium]|nr:hypothetical protein [Chthonomonadales bacterium]